MYSCSPTLSQISLKNSFGKVVFQILAKIEMTWNKNWLFGRHLETVQHFQFFFAELWIFIAYRVVSNKRSPSNKRPPNLFSNKTR